MNQECKSILEDFLRRVTSASLAVVLTGSYANGQEHDHSDIDLIIVTKNLDAAQNIRTICNELNKSLTKPFLDCKVYTNQELIREKSGKGNLFLWTSLKNGKLLYGRDITTEIDLRPQAVIDLVWEHLVAIESACDMLELGTKFTGCCYQFYNALVTLYFINRYIFQSIDLTITKSNFMESHLGNHYKIVRERYYWVFNHLNDIFSNILNVPSAIDKKVKSKLYRQMYTRGKMLLNLLTQEFHKLNDWFNSQI
jgi:predicted nucleotidyltransferase